MPRDISIVLKGNYTDRDVKRAIRDLHSLETQGPRTSRALKNVGVVLGLAAGAAALLAVKVGTDAVKAFMEDEESADRLATTLGNLGLAHERAGVEKFIDDMQFATGIADNDLRPAYDRIVRSTEDVGEAQRVLSIAMDVATAKGRTVSQVADIFGKALDGNTVSLSRLGVGVDKTILKSGNMAAIWDEIERKFSGQAAAAAETLGGKLRILNVGVDELQESAGRGLVKGFFDTLSGGTDDIDQVSASLREAQGTVEVFGQVAGSAAASALMAMSNIGLGAMKLEDTLLDASAGTIRALVNTMDFLGKISDEEGQYIRDTLDAADAERDAAMAAYVLATNGDSAASALSDAADAASGAQTSVGGFAGAADKAAGRVKTLNDEVDRMNRGLDHLSARASVEASVDAFATATTGTGKKQHHLVTDWNSRKDSFNLGSAAGRQGFDLAKDLITAVQAEAATEKAGAARKTFREGRRDLVAALVSIGVDRDEARAFTRANLRTPHSLRDPGVLPYTDESQKASASVYNFYGGISVSSSAALDQTTKEARRLAASGGGRFSTTNVDPSR